MRRCLPQRAVATTPSHSEPFVCSPQSLTGLLRRCRAEFEALASELLYVAAIEVHAQAAARSSPGGAAALGQTALGRALRRALALHRGPGAGEPGGTEPGAPGPEPAGRAVNLSRSFFVRDSPSPSGAACTRARPRSAAPRVQREGPSLLDRMVLQGAAVAIGMPPPSRVSLHKERGTDKSLT